MEQERIQFAVFTKPWRDPLPELGRRVSALREVGYDSYITSEVLPAYKYHRERLIYETSAAISTIFGLP